MVTFDAGDPALDVGDLQREPGAVGMDPDRGIERVGDGGNGAGAVVGEVGDRPVGAHGGGDVASLVEGLPPARAVDGGHFQGLVALVISGGRCAAVGQSHLYEVPGLVVGQFGGVAEGIGSGEGAVVRVPGEMGGVAEGVGLGDHLEAIVEDQDGGGTGGVCVAGDAVAGVGVDVVGEPRGQDAVGADGALDPPLGVVRVLEGRTVAVRPGRDAAVGVVGETHGRPVGAVRTGQRDEVASRVVVVGHHRDRAFRAADGQPRDARGVRGELHDVATRVCDCEGCPVGTAGEGDLVAVAVFDVREPVGGGRAVGAAGEEADAAVVRIAGSRRRSPRRARHRGRAGVGRPPGATLVPRRTGAGGGRPARNRPRVPISHCPPRRARSSHPGWRPNYGRTSGRSGRSRHAYGAVPRAAPRAASGRSAAAASCPWRRRRGRSCRPSCPGKLHVIAGRQWRSAPSRASFVCRRHGVRPVPNVPACRRGVRRPCRHRR